MTGGGVGFGFLPQIEVYEPPIKMIVWGNSTHTDASPAIGFHRVGEVDHTVMVRANDEPISFTLPPFSGEYRLSGGKMRRRQRFVCAWLGLGRQGRLVGDVRR